MERVTLTVTELSKYLGVSDDIIYAMARKNQIPHIRIGVGRGRILFRKDSIDAWMKEKEARKEANSRL